MFTSISTSTVSHNLRLRRYFQPKRGELKCSHEALAMWKDDAGSFLVATSSIDYRISVGHSH